MISIIVPTLNESKNILKFVKNLRFLKFKYELIFVDDNSSDNSNQIFKKIKNKKINFIIRKAKKKDLSKSVLLGIDKSRYNNVMIMDCDLQHSLKDANKMKSIFFKNKLDLIIGSRFLKKKYFGNIFFIRSMFSLFFIFVINLIFVKKTTDPLSGFFICKKAIVKKNKKNFFSRGYKILFDIIYNTNSYIKIKDIQINFKNRVGGKSKLSLKIILMFLTQIIYSKMR